MNDNERQTCLLCNGNNLRFVRKYRTDSKHGKRLFGKAGLYICANCSFVQMIPVPTDFELVDYYKIDYRYGERYGSEVANVSEFPCDNLFYLNRGESIAELVSKSFNSEKESEPVRILDIGAGFGHVLHAFGRRFTDPELFAIEISEVCIKHMTSLGIKVYSELAEDILPELDEQFDIIVLSHVLEHLANPKEMVRLLRNRLSNNGLLYIEVPNIPVESLKKYPDNKWAPRVDEPHITFFSRETLKRILKNEDMKILFCETGGEKYQYVSSVRFRLPRLQPFILNHMPRRLFLALRKQRFASSLRVQMRENSFYEYGGFRIWIRSISTKNGR